MTQPPRTLTISSDTFWYDKLPGWAMPSILRAMPSVLADLESLTKRNPRKISFSENLSFVLNYLEINIVPRAKKGNDNAKPAGNKSYKSSVQWINVSLTDDDINAIVSVSYNADNVASQLLGLCLEGYSIGVKPTPDATGWMAYITGIASDNPDITVGLTGYSDAPVDAVVGLLYKFHDKLDGILNAPGESVSRKFR